MLFQSQGFILLFLPITVALYYLVAQSARAAAMGADRRFARVLRLVGRALHSAARRRPDRPDVAAGARSTSAAAGSGRSIAGVVLNLASLGDLQVSRFPARHRSSRRSASRCRARIVVLPIGISFFSFQLISYLVDRMREDAPLYPFRPFALFVLLFPHLIAGPIVRHNELVPQFDQDPRRDGLWARIGLGLVLFTVGFAKKVLLADRLATIVDPLFDQAPQRALDLRRSLDGDARLLVPALSRLLRLYRDGDRHRAPVRPAAAGEFPPPLSSPPTCASSGGAGTSRCRTSCAIISTSRSAAAVTALRATCSRPGHHGPVRAVARGRVDLRRVGPVARRRAHHLPRLAAARAADAGAAGWAITMLFVLVGWVLFRAADFATAASILDSLAAATASPARLPKRSSSSIARWSARSFRRRTRSRNDAAPMPWPAIAVGAAVLAGLLRARGRQGRAGQLHLFPVLRTR